MNHPLILAHNVGGDGCRSLLLFPLPENPVKTLDPTSVASIVDGDIAVFDFRSAHTINNPSWQVAWVKPVAVDNLTISSNQLRRLLDSVTTADTTLVDDIISDAFNSPTTGPFLYHHTDLPTGNTPLDAAKAIENATTITNITRSSSHTHKYQWDPNPPTIDCSISATLHAAATSVTSFDDILAYVKACPHGPSDRTFLFTRAFARLATDDSFLHDINHATTAPLSYYDNFRTPPNTDKGTCSTPKCRKTGHSYLTPAGPVLACSDHIPRNALHPDTLYRPYAYNTLSHNPNHPVHLKTYSSDNGYLLAIHNYDPRISYTDQLASFPYTVTIDGQAVPDPLHRLVQLLHPEDTPEPTVPTANKAWPTITLSTAPQE